MTSRVSIEDEILTQLLYNEPYARNISPYIKREYFENRTTQIIFDEFEDYLQKYASVPTREALSLELETRSDISDDELTAIITKLDECHTLGKEPAPDQQWLADTTENYCQERALFLGVMKAIAILDGTDTNMSKNAIPEVLTNALGVSFDHAVGHDYLTSAEKRWEFMHKKEARMEFDLDWLNLVTGGGLPKKTLSVALAPTNAGKTLVKCHMAASFLRKGYNVLYITMEMAEERISERIDANLLDVNLDDLKGLPKDIFVNKVNKLADKTSGQLFVKEYPTASAHAGHFRHLLDELRIKEQFVPDVVFIDYLNICASARVKDAGNTYVLVKSIAEELRGLAVEKNVAIISSTQTNRDAWGASDIDLANTSESAGLPATADFMWGIIVTEQLNQMGQIMFKQLKNRFSDVTRNITQPFNIDRPKMRLTNVEDVSTGYSSPNEEKAPWNINEGTCRESDGKVEDPFADFQY